VHGEEVVTQHWSNHARMLQCFEDTSVFAVILNENLVVREYDTRVSGRGLEGDIILVVHEQQANVSRHGVATDTKGILFLAKSEVNVWDGDEPFHSLDVEKRIAADIQCEEDEIQRPSATYLEWLKEEWGGGDSILLSYHDGITFSLKMSQSKSYMRAFLQC
jgi:hypothetical protein